MQTSPYDAKTLFCENSTYVVLVELSSPASGNKEYPNLLKKRKRLCNDTSLSG